MVIKVGTVHGRVAPGAETSALRQAPGMALFADDREIHLRVATQTEIIVPGYEHFGVHGPVDLMACRTAFTDRLMLKNKRAALLFVTVEAGLINTLQSGRRPSPYIRAMRAVACRAIHFSF